MSSSEPLSIRQLEVFVALDEHGSFTRAAKTLRLSQSTVSGHIADLERRLGVRLVERERGGVRPTAAGRALLRPARQVLQAERNARMAITALTGLLSGTLVVGGSNIPSTYLLPRLFGLFRQRHPRVALELVAGDSRATIEHVRNADVEVAIVGARPEGDDLWVEHYDSDRMVLVFPPDHPFAAQETVTADALFEHPLVMREQGSGTRLAVERALEGLVGERRLVQLSVACELGSNEALKSAVEASLGAAFMSDLAVRAELAAGTLRTRPVEGLEARRDFLLVSRKEELLGPAAMAFRRFCSEHAAGQAG